ncbi:MAG: lamin tail domain-containing protein [Candidatus Woesearchaeota archaeon]
MLYKPAAYLCIILLLTIQAGARVLISEVIVDPVLTDTGGEAVELYNTEGFAVDISGYSIMTKSSSRDAVLPNGSIIPPYGFFLIADAGWASSKDNSSWPDADYEEAITLANSDAGVALLSPDGEILDALGWGNPSNMDGLLYEGTPMPNPQSGKSFERKPGMLIPAGGNYIDSNNNSADFIIRDYPEPQNSRSQAEEKTPSASLQLTFTVMYQTGSTLLLLQDENPTKEGIQITPKPGASRQVKIFINTTVNSSFCGILSNEFVNKNFTFIRTDSGMISNLSMNYYDAPGNYTVRAGPCGSAYNSTLTFEYEPMIAFSLDSEEIRIDSISAGASFEWLGDSDFSTSDRPTLANLGNKAFRIGAFSTEFSGKASTLPPSIVSISFSESAGDMLTLNESLREGPYLNPSELVPVSIRIDVPSDSKEGIYSGVIFLTARSG